ncbi:MAG TPA: hypothetical protein VGP08_20110 [Pyrinomonadaceae bacterium]|jgi:hypothetical protein|nr:hypothetical protein [Pyrinomonadaceae bacterium]
MAVFVFGSEVQELGRVGDLQCSVCNSKRTFNAAARYGYLEAGPFGVAGFTQYSIACAACKTVWPLDGKQAKAFKKEGLLVPPDVPPLRKFGLLAAALLIVALISLNKFGPLITAGSVLAVVAVVALPGVVRGVRNKGLKAYTKDAVSADRPVSLFESVGGLPSERVTKRDLFRKCPSCGLNNAPAESLCERCGASLSS